MTRIFVAVDMPISLARGRIRTGAFLINLTDSYAVNIDTGDSRLVSPSCTSYNRVQANWTLYRDEKVLQRSSETLDTYLGRFNAENAKYDLDLNILSDSSCLDSGHPRLEIYTNKISYIDTVDELLIVSLTTFITGLSLIILRALPITRIAYTRQLQLTDAPDFRQYYPYAQTLPLRRKFEGFSSFGLLATITSIVLLIPIWVITRSNAESRGLRISLLKQGAMPISNDPWMKPIIIKIIDLGPEKIPVLDLNSKPVSWGGLAYELKEEVGKRPPGAVVYIDGDGNLPWADIAYVVDIARGLQARVILLTRDQSLSHKRSQY